MYNFLIFNKFTELCNHHHHPTLVHFHHPKKDPSCPFAAIPQPRLTFNPRQSQICLVSLEICLFCTFYVMEHTVCGLEWSIFEMYNFIVGIILDFTYFFYSGFSVYRVFTLSVSLRNSDLSYCRKFTKYCWHWNLSLL